MLNRDFQLIYESPTLSRDLMELFIGKEIGNGSGRTVYECVYDPTVVIKVETWSQSFQNINEWRAWEDSKEHKSVSKWLAPCVAISNCGTILIQKRTEPCSKDQYPKKLPDFFTDYKYKNFGIYKGKFVCHDYGLLRLEYDLKLKKVKWWSE